MVRYVEAAARAGDTKVAEDAAKGPPETAQAGGTEQGLGLDIDRAFDILYAPSWLRLLVGHRPVNQAAADRLSASVWSELKKRTEG